MTTKIQGAVVLGFGPQDIDFLPKASKICGKGAIVDPGVARMAGAVIAAGLPEALGALRERLTANARLQASADAPNAPPGAVEWLATGERGLSSEALFSCLTGIAVSSARDRKCHPHDPADFRRCRLMLEAIPALKDKLGKALSLSPVWWYFITRWAELCKVMDEETPDWRAARGSSPLLYAQIREVIRYAEKHPPPVAA